MVARVGVLLIGIGVLLLTGFDRQGVQLVGLGLWWVGLLMFVDDWIGGGLPAQFLWGIGVGGAVALYMYTEVPRWATQGPGQLVIALATLALAVVILVRRVRGSRGLRG